MALHLAATLHCPHHLVCRHIHACGPRRATGVRREAARGNPFTEHAEGAPRNAQRTQKGKGQRAAWGNLCEVRGRSDSVPPAQAPDLAMAQSMKTIVMTGATGGSDADAAGAAPGENGAGFRTRSHSGAPRTPHLPTKTRHVCARAFAGRIGRHIARSIVQRGDRLAMIVRDRSVGEKLADELYQSHPSAKINVSELTGCQNVGRRGVRTFTPKQPLARRGPRISPRHGSQGIAEG